MYKILVFGHTKSVRQNYLGGKNNMRKEQKAILLEDMFGDKGINFGRTPEGLLYTEIASAMVDSLSEINVSYLDKGEIKSMTEQVIKGLSEQVSWGDYVSDIITETPEYMKAEELADLDEDEEFAEEFHVDVYSLDDEEDLDGDEDDSEIEEEDEEDDEDGEDDEDDNEEEDGEDDEDDEEHD